MQKRIVLWLYCLNIHKYAKENPYGCDMEMDLTNIYFQNINILSYEPMISYKLNDDGIWCADEQLIIYTGDKARERFINAFKDGFCINGADIRKSDGLTIFDFDTNHPVFFNAAFSFSDVMVEWDSYCKKALYELHGQYRYDITLLTPNGEQKEPLYVLYNQEDEYHPSISVCLKYKEREFCGHGNDYLWVDAFADIQNQLPDGVILKCCLTCCHGNMCPFGNKPGEVFCTKDLLIASKEDMCNLFSAQDIAKAEERTRSYTDACEKYRHQSFDVYTYSD